jgi:hypothetical protein
MLLGCQLGAGGIGIGSAVGAVPIKPIKSMGFTDCGKTRFIEGYRLKPD